MNMRSEAATRAAWAATCVVVAVWALRWLWGGELPPGVDTTGHLTRLEVGLDLFAAGRLDGWFDRAMLGYQTHLMYGPGLALAVGTARLLSFGTLSIPGAYEVVGIAAYVALPFAGHMLARAFGLPVPAARAAGLLMLAVSSGRGGGIVGAFDIGLMPNHLAAPMVVAAWALLLHRRQRPVLLGVLVAAVLLTHPQSALLLVGFAPLVLGAGALVGVVDRHRWRPLALAALVALGATAWWWIPAVAHRDLRGTLTGWDVPTYVEHLRLMATGQRGWMGIAGTVAGLSWLAAVVTGLVRRDRQPLVLAALPVVALGSVHIAQWLLADHAFEVTLFPNRGLMYVAYLSAPLIGWAAERSLRPLHPAAPWAGAAVVAVLAVAPLVPPDSVRDRPVPGLRHGARILEEVVEDGHRFAYVESPDDHVGVPAPGRWLGWASGRTNLGPFGAEYAPGVELTLLVFEPPEHDEVDTWVERVRPLLVSHLVAGDPRTAEVLAGATRLDLVARHNPVTIWEVQGPSTLRVVDADRESLEVEVHVPDEGHVADGRSAVRLPLGYSPGWSATLDGEEVALHRADDDRLAIELPRGTHRVSLRWSEPAIHGAARFVSLAALLLAVGARWTRRRRSSTISR